MTERRFSILVLATCAMCCSTIQGHRGSWIKFNDEYEFKISELGKNATRSEAKSNCSTDHGKLAKLKDVAEYFMSMNITGQFWIGSLSVNICSGKSSSRQYTIGVIGNVSDIFNCTAIVTNYSFIGLKRLSCNDQMGYVCMRERTTWSEWSNCSLPCFGNQSRNMVMPNNTMINETRPCNGTECSVSITTTTFVSTTESDITTTATEYVTSRNTETSKTSKSTASSTPELSIAKSEVTTKPSNCRPLTWSFDGGSFLIGFILLLPPLAAVTVKYYLMLKAAKLKKTSEHKYQDIEDVKKPGTNNYAGDRKGFNVQSVSNRPPHYENVVGESASNTNSTLGNQLNHNDGEFSAYEPVHHDNKEDEDEDGYITHPESTPGNTEQFDGYENPISIKRTKVTTESSGYVNLKVLKTNPTIPNVALKPQVALKPPNPVIDRKSAANKPPSGSKLDLNSQNVENANTDVFKVALKPVVKSTSSPTTKPKIVLEKEAGRRPQYALKPIEKPKKDMKPTSPKARGSIDNIADARKALTPVKK